MLGDDDPVADLLAAGALDLRLGFDVGDDDSSRLRLHSGPGDLAELRMVVETATGVGTWPTAGAGPGRLRRCTLSVARPAALLGLLIAMDGLIERRSPWGRWRTMVDTMAARVAEIDTLTVEVRVLEPAR